MSLATRILFAPIWVPAWLVLKVLIALYPATAAVIDSAHDDLIDIPDIAVPQQHTPDDWEGFWSQPDMLRAVDAYQHEKDGAS